MDICQLKYLASIIENDFNITRAAEKLHISQPALSKSITLLESELNIQLFIRTKGRLAGLSPSGQIFFEKSKDLLNNYDELVDMIKFRSLVTSDTLLIGIPPLVITALFPDLFHKLQDDNPNIEVSIIEYGSAKLTELMHDLKLDLSVLVSPTGLNSEEYEEILLHEGEQLIYMSDTHPLANKSILSWSDLNHQDIAVADETYQTYRLFRAKLESEQIKVSSYQTFTSWDYLFASIRNSNSVTIFPYVLKYLFNMEGVKELPIEDPLKWKIVLAYRKSKKLSPIEKYTINFIVNYFKTNSFNV